MPYPNTQNTTPTRQSRNQGQRQETDFLSEIERFDKLNKNTVGLILKNLEQKGDYNEYIDNIRTYVDAVAKKISSSQLRNIFSRIKKIKEYKELYLIRPKLAYLSGRASEREMKRLLFLLDHLIKEVNDNNKLEEFKNFFEAVIAYHKYFGGKD